LDVDVDIDADVDVDVQPQHQTDGQEADLNQTDEDLEGASKM
jgi:hypothetical protein